MIRVPRQIVKVGAGNVKQDWMLREDDLRLLRRGINATSNWKSDGKWLYIGETEKVECASAERAAFIATLRNAFLLVLNDNVKLRSKLRDALASNHMLVEMFRKD